MISVKDIHHKGIKNTKCSEPKVFLKSFFLRSAPFAPFVS